MIAVMPAGGSGAGPPRAGSVAAIGAHQPEVVREREHQAAGERVSVDRGERDAREGEHAREEAVHAAQVVGDLADALARERIEREAVRVELPSPTVTSAVPSVFSTSSSARP
jgi:hypothetical protein